MRRYASAFLQVINCRRQIDLSPATATHKASSLCLAYLQSMAMAGIKVADGGAGVRAI